SWFWRSSSAWWPGQSPLTRGFGTEERLRTTSAGRAQERRRRGMRGVNASTLGWRVALAGLPTAKPTRLCRWKLANLVRDRVARVTFAHTGPAESAERLSSDRPRRNRVVVVAARLDRTLTD